MSSKSTLVPFGTGVGVALRLLSTPISPSSRVREPVKPTTGRVVGYFPSVKNNRSIAWESQLEQKACYVFEFSPEIIKYREQPLSIYYRLNGELLRYTPDFELTLLSGELIYVEVKPGAKLQTQELQEKLGAIKGAVERFLGTLNRAVCHRLSGTTFSNIQQRNEYDSASSAKTTLSV